MSAPGSDAGGRAAAAFYDGATAARRQVSLEFDVTHLAIREGERILACWPLAAIRRRSGPDGLLRLALAGGPPLARLDVADPAGRAAIEAGCPALEADDHPESVPRILAWSAAAAASLIVSILYLVPLLAAMAVPLVPLSVERRLGVATDNQLRLLLGRETCTAAPGAAALARLVHRLRAAAPGPIPPDVLVLPSRVPNAVALPGGRIYLFDGLLQRAESVDEVAGVLAHEMGHVAHRDGLRLLFQAGGTSFLIGLLFGDVSGGGAIVLASRILVDGAHSRDAERDADRFAADLMLAQGRSPEPMGRLLRRIDTGGKLPALLSSHPLTDERLAALSARVPPTAGAPLLTEAEWQDLRAICAPPS
jgi:Zn-dependent protease with chaperone function